MSCAASGFCVTAGTVTATRRYGRKYLEKEKQQAPFALKVKTGAVWERPAVPMGTRSPLGSGGCLSTGGVSFPQTASCSRSGCANLFSSNDCSVAVLTLESPSMNKLCTGKILGPAMQNEISETPSQVALTYLKELLLDFPVWWDFIQVIWQGLFSWLRRCSYCGLLACCTVSAEQSWFHGESQCHLDALGGSVNSLCWPGSTLVTLHNI